MIFFNLVHLFCAKFKNFMISQSLFYANTTIEITIKKEEKEESIEDSKKINVVFVWT